jgi:hypothetical protein
MHQTKPSTLPSRMRSAAGKKTSEARDRIASVACTIPGQEIQRGSAFSLRAAIEVAPTNSPSEAPCSVPR